MKSSAKWLVLVLVQRLFVEYHLSTYPSIQTSRPLYKLSESYGYFESEITFAK